MKLFVITKRHLVAITCIVITLTLGLIAGVSTYAASDRLLPIYCVETDKKQIAISFDAAWGADDTTTLIDILSEYQVPATFFVVGAWVDKYPEAVKALSDAGHQVQNHSNSHPNMPQLSMAQMIDELQSCNNKITAVTGRTPTLFRAPYGDYDNNTITAVENAGMKCVQWSIDTIDIKVMTNEYHYAIMSIV